MNRYDEIMKELESVFQKLLDLEAPSLLQQEFDKRITNKASKAEIEEIIEKLAKYSQLESLIIDDEVNEIDFLNSEKDLLVNSSLDEIEYFSDQD